MSGILKAAKLNAEAAKNRPAKVLRADPKIDVSDLTPYQAAKKIAAAKAKDEPR